MECVCALIIWGRWRISLCLLSPLRLLLSDLELFALTLPERLLFSVQELLGVAVDLEFVVRKAVDCPTWDSCPCRSWCDLWSSPMCWSLHRLHPEQQSAPVCAPTVLQMSRMRGWTQVASWHRRRRRARGRPGLWSDLPSCNDQTVFSKLNTSCNIRLDHTLRNDWWYTYQTHFLVECFHVIPEPVLLLPGLAAQVLSCWQAQAWLSQHLSLNAALFSLNTVVQRKD